MEKVPEPGFKWGYAIFVLLLLSILGFIAVGIISLFAGVDVESLAAKLRFSDRAGGWVSLVHLFERPKGLAAEILKGGMFDKCFLEMGALAWPNGFELCPDALRQWFEMQHHSTRKRAA